MYDNVRYKLILGAIVTLVLVFSGCLLGYIPFLKDSTDHLPDDTWPKFHQHFETTVELVKAMTTVIEKLYVFYQRWREHNQDQETNDERINDDFGRNCV